MSKFLPLAFDPIGEGSSIFIDATGLMFAEKWRVSCGRSLIFLEESKKVLFKGERNILALPSVMP